MWALQRIGTLPHPHTRACSRHDPPNSGVAAHTANSFTRLCHSTLRHASIASHVEASSAPFVGAGPGSQPSQAAGVSPQQTATRQQSGEPVSTPATRQPTESENRRSRPHSAAASNSSGGGSEGREDAGLLGGGHSSGHGRSGGGGGNSGSGGGGTGPGPGPDGGGDDGDAKGTPANRYPTWLRVSGLRKQLAKGYDALLCWAWRSPGGAAGKRLRCPSLLRMEKPGWGGPRRVQSRGSMYMAVACPHVRQAAPRIWIVPEAWCFGQVCRHH